MKIHFILISFFAILTSTTVWAADSMDLVLTARAVKAIYDRGLPLPQIVDVTFAEQTSFPPKLCVMVIYERNPNTLCPDDPMVGPNLDQGYAACFNPQNNLVDSVIGIKTPDCM